MIPGGYTLSEHHGVVTLDGQALDVTIQIELERIRLATNGTEIGNWNSDECQIVESGSAGYLILAENEELPFTPLRTELFAAALAETISTDQEQASEPVTTVETVEEPEPGPVTMVAFYLLAAVTAALGLWATWSLIF